MAPVPDLPSSAGAIREATILLAARMGLHGDLGWWPVESTHGGRRATLFATTDALKIDGVRVNVTHATAQRIADALGARLPTSRISDLVWQQAAVRCAPQLQSPCSSSTDAMRLHSGAVGAEIHGRAGLCSTVGKDWVLTARLHGHADRAANYGWHKADGSVWQTVGTAHNLAHSDYSQTLRLISAEVLVDGAPRQLDDLLRDRALAPLVSAEGALPIIRHPGVPVYSPPPVPLDASIGARAVRWSLCRAGCRETGTNTSPEIKAWLWACKRGDRPLGLTSGNWCAAFASAATYAVLRSGETPPHGYRAGVVELVADAQESGAWRPAELALDGRWDPMPGDLAVYDRSDPARPETSWWRHVNRVAWCARGSRLYSTVGGNEGQSVREGEQTLDNPGLLGFIEMPREALVEPPEITDEDRARTLALVAVFHDQISRREIWGLPGDA